DQLLKDMHVESYIGMPLYSAQGNVLGILVAMHTAKIENEAEITALFEIIGYRIAAELERVEQDRSLNMLSSIFKHSAEAMLVTDAEQKIIEVNQAFCDMFGYSRKQVLGLEPQLFSSGLHEKSFYRNFWSKVFQKGVWQGEIKNRHANGSVLEQWVSVNQVRDDNGHIHHYTAIYTDLTELNKTQAENLYLANTDPLSGLSSKSLLAEELKSPGMKSLLIVGIDGLRYLNDAYGFDVCDELIRSAARIIQSQVVADCYVGGGPGKFVLLFKRPVDLYEVADKLRMHFRHHQVSTADVSVFVSLSFGGARGRTDLLRLGVTALRQSRESGDLKCIVLEQDAIAAESQQHLLFVEANNIIHSAVNQQLIVPYFQGIHDNRLGVVTHYEALARIHYNDQVLTPYSFIDAAKVAGMLPLITRQMAQQAFKVMKHHGYTFSLNITEYDLNAQYLQRFLSELCQQHQIAPQRVILEVLEGISSSGKDSHLKQLKALKQAGFKLAIDDFGTEHSNFERVLDLEVDYLKIDARYIKQIHTDTKSYEIVKALSYFCRNSGIKCIAEFVHSVEVQQCLLALGLDYSQGFLFSRPESFGEHQEQGEVVVEFDKVHSNMVHLKLSGHIHKAMRFTDAFRRCLAEREELVTYGLFDFRYSDYFQMGEADLIDRARLAAIEPQYQQFHKVALLVEGRYAEKMADVWRQYVVSAFEVQVFSDEAAARKWLLADVRLSLIA
ncbi:EAL domain-containing protein, partial [uncultured Alteromonas sp.]|uniref:sensor domain-containing phosphodiesterase n=1 Tax=uncultured Alteromonas sp. TaxID=179113 RepID=UPI0025FD9AEA